MDDYLEMLFWNILGLKLNDSEKKHCLFELNIAVEKILLIIYTFSKKYHIGISAFSNNIIECTYDEILNIGKTYFAIEQ